jgi:hypothetical protein
MNATQEQIIKAAIARGEMFDAEVLCGGKWLKVDVHTSGGNNIFLNLAAMKRAGKIQLNETVTSRFNGTTARLVKAGL